MGNHKMEHRRPQINTTSLIMSEVAIVETWIKPTGIVAT
jgi:hypothetical protein